MELIFILALVFFVVLILHFFSRTSSSNLDGSYILQEKFFTDAERSFLGVLDAISDNDWRILGKVRVADVITPQKGLDKKVWWSMFAKISSKHFDYLICDKTSMLPIMVVELDDKSHSTKRAKKRDELINLTCQQAGLPLARFKVKTSYQLAEVKERLLAELITTDKEQVKYEY